MSSYLGPISALFTRPDSSSLTKEDAAKVCITATGHLAIAALSTYAFYSFGLLPTPLLSKHSVIAIGTLFLLSPPATCITLGAAGYYYGTAAILAAIAKRSFSAFAIGGVQLFFGIHFFKDYDRTNAGRGFLGYPLEKLVDRLHMPVSKWI